MRQHGIRAMPMAQQISRNHTIVRVHRRGLNPADRAGQDGDRREGMFKVGS